MCNWNLMGVIANWGELVGEENMFLNGGNFWLIRYKGGEPQILESMDGFKYLQFYLQNPGQQYKVEEMAIHVDGITVADTGRGISDYSDQDLNSDFVDMVIDEKALRVCKNRLREIKEIMEEEELEEEELEKYRKETTKIKDYLSQTSRKGKPRLETGNTKKERDRVTSALRRAIATIKTKFPQLGAHLEAHIDLRFKGGYFPSQPICWKF